MAPMNKTQSITSIKHQNSKYICGPATALMGVHSPACQLNACIQEHHQIPFKALKALPRKTFTFDLKYFLANQGRIFPMLAEAIR